MPKFSIIIPVYNVAPYLRECLDSVLAQTFTDWEAICVDDGSTDGSGAILDEYAANDSRFHVIHQANAGVSAARNAALDVAPGEWITFVDADDRIAPWRIGFLAKTANENPSIDWIKETRYETNSSASELSESLSVVNRIIDNKDVFLFAWQTQKDNALLCLNSFKRQSIQTLRFPIGVRYAEDDIFELRAAQFVSSCAEVGFGGYWYRDDRVGAASRRIGLDDSIRIHHYLVKIVEEQRDLIENLSNQIAFRKVFTQTVRKDFGRVWRDWYRFPLATRRAHAALSRTISRSPYFSLRYVGYCRVGYGVYLITGTMVFMMCEDVLIRVVKSLLHRLK